MATIRQFKSKKEKQNDWLKETIDYMEKEEVTSFLIAGKDKNGNWITGYFNMDSGIKYEALGHINADIIDQMIKANMDNYVELV